VAGRRGYASATAAGHRNGEADHHEDLHEWLPLWRAPDEVVGMGDAFDEMRARLEAAFTCTRETLLVAVSREAIPGCGAPRFAPAWPAMVVTVLP
jgi:hypothetical protein